MAKKLSDTIDINQVADLLHLPDHDRLQGDGIDWIFKFGCQAYDYVIDKGGSEEDAEQAREDAESEASDEIFNQWYDGVERAADELFEVHGLTLIPDGSDRRPFKFQIKPKVSWNDAAKKIVETINGVGYFWFQSLEEFLDSGPYTAREAVLSHLHYIPQYPDVYGTPSARTIYDHSFR
jgi:hypothetical protein